MVWFIHVTHLKAHRGSEVLTCSAYVHLNNKPTSTTGDQNGYTVNAQETFLFVMKSHLQGGTIKSLYSLSTFQLAYQKSSIYKINKERLFKMPAQTTPLHEKG